MVKLPIIIEIIDKNYPYPEHFRSFIMDYTNSSIM